MVVGTTTTTLPSHSRSFSATSSSSLCAFPLSSFFPHASFASFPKTSRSLGMRLYPVASKFVVHMCPLGICPPSPSSFFFFFAFTLHSYYHSSAIFSLVYSSSLSLSLSFYIFHSLLLSFCITYEST